MASNRKKNEATVWLWLLVIIVMGVPGINVIMAIYWAFSGENASFRNYFKAYLLILLFFLLVIGGLAAIGLAPTMREWFLSWSKQR